MAEFVPSIEILEQPAPRKFRFRYECENRSSGALLGVRSTSTMKTYPTIRVVGCTGNATIVVSLVTATEPYKVHPNKINYKENPKKKVFVRGGALLMDVNGTEPIVLDGMSVVCVRKTDIVASLEDRKKKKIDPFRSGFKHIENYKSINLGAVRLAFELYINREQKHRIVSDPIFDKKSVSDLVVHHISTESSVVTGGAKVMMFCDKVKKGDIVVQFRETTAAGDNVWAVIAKQDLYIHHQMGILFKAPAYPNLGIDRPVQTYMQLMRPSDGITSEPLPFQYYPAPSSFPGKIGKRTKISANAISISNISIKQEDAAKVKRNKLANCNIKSESIAAGAHALPKPSQSDRINQQTVSYAQQMPQFELPQHSFQYTMYPREQENYQMYPMPGPAANACPNDNRNFAPMMPQQNYTINRNHNMSYNQSAFDGGTNGPIGNYMMNYPMAQTQQQLIPQQPPPQSTLSNWRTPNAVQPTNTYYPAENSRNEYVTNAAMLNCNNDNFNALQRQSEMETLQNAGTILADVTNFNYDGTCNVVENPEGTLSNSMTNISLH